MSKIDILSIAKEAQIAKQKNQFVVDATIGMFYDDQMNLVIPDVKDAFLNLDIFETFKYGSTDGGKIFEENVINWVLSSKKELVQSKYKLTSIATPGGSGALSIIFSAYGNPGDKVLVPNIRWRYEYFTKTARMYIHEHNLFKNDVFDIEDFKKQLKFLSDHQKRVIVVINDPCHNPTGYQLSSDEWSKIINIVNELENNEIIITYDLAYFDYDPNGYEQARKTFEYFLKLKNHVQVLICFSASKSFSMYGVRLGGLLGLHHNENQVQFFKENAVEDALGKWSTAPSVGVGIFNKISEQKEKYLVTLERLTNILKQRGQIFLEESKKEDLKLYNYQGGFFVLIKSINAQEDFVRLKEEGIYLIPMKEGLRLALSGITTDEVYGLAKRIKSIINQ